MKSGKAALLPIAALALMAFTTEDAQRVINGEWQAQGAPVALSVNTSTGQATYVEGGQRVSGPFSVSPLAGQSFSLKINDEVWVIHVTTTSGNNISISKDGQRSSWGLAKVR